MDLEPIHQVVANEVERRLKEIFIVGYKAGQAASMYAGEQDAEKAFNLIVETAGLNPIQKTGKIV